MTWIKLFRIWYNEFGEEEWDNFFLLLGLSFLNFFNDGIINYCFKGEKK